LFYDSCHGRTDFFSENLYQHKKRKTFITRNFSNQNLGVKLMVNEDGFAVLVSDFYEQNQLFVPIKLIQILQRVM
jgi:hypothetical protein